MGGLFRINRLSLQKNLPPKDSSGPPEGPKSGKPGGRKGQEGSKGPGHGQGHGRGSGGKAPKKHDSKGREGKLPPSPPDDTERLEEEGSLTVIGLSPVKEALLLRGENLRRLCVSRGREKSPVLTEILDILKDLGHSPRFLPQSFFTRFKPAAHQGIAAYFDDKPPLSFEEFLNKLPPKPPSLILALDQVEDPGNLGAILRSAWGFGALGVLAPKDRSARLTSAAIKVSAGGSEHVPLVYVTNLSKALETLKEKGFWTVGAQGGGGESLFTFSFPNRTVLILGSEGKGMRRLTKTKVDYTVKIPLAKGVDSLNVASAGAVFMYAFRNYFDEN